jgi:replicative DNA helicase
VVKKRPQLSDLRESGAIEQDADMVIFLYRPEYYKITQDAEGNNTAGMAEIIISKHRNGALATLPVRFIDRLAKFAELENFMPAGEGQIRIMKSKMSELPDEDASSDEPLPW